MSQLNFDKINKAIHGIRGSERHSEFEKKAKELSVAFRLAKENFSKATKLEPSAMLTTRTVDWYNEFDTQTYIVWDDKPTVAKLEEIVESAKKGFDNWVNKTIAAIEFAKVLASDYPEDGAPRDNNYIQFTNDNNCGEDIVRFIPTEKEKARFATVKEKARIHAKSEITEIEGDISVFTDELSAYSSIWFASPEYAESKSKINDIDIKNGRIRSCKTLSAFLKMFPNPSAEEVEIFDSNRV